VWERVVVAPGGHCALEVGVVAEEALKVAVAQEGSVPAMAEDSREVVMVSEGHDIAIWYTSLLLLGASERCVWWEVEKRTRSRHLKMVCNSRVLTTSSMSLS
jgi:hypothetical protein